MRLAVELAIGVAAGGIAYYLARPEPPRREALPGAPRRATVRGERPGPEHPAGDAIDHAAERGAAIPMAARDPAAAHTDPETRRSLEQQAEMATLRNAVIVESSRDLRSRGQSLVRCLDGVRLAGTEKLRLAVDVESTPLEATLGRWRFVEVVDGEPLPPSFAPCAARVLGGGQHVVPESQLHFPDYRGELSMVYTLSAPDNVD